MNRSLVSLLSCAVVVLAAQRFVRADEEGRDDGRAPDPRLFNLTLEMTDAEQHAVRVRGESDLADGAIVTVHIEADGFMVPNCMHMKVGSGKFEDVFFPGQPFRPGCYVFHAVFDSMLQPMEIKERYAGCNPPTTRALLQVGDYAAIRLVRDKAKELAAARTAEVTAWLGEYRATFQRIVKTLPNESAVTQWLESVAERDKAGLARTVETNRERMVNFTASLPLSGKAVTKAYSMLLGASSKYKRALRIASGLESAGELTPEILVETGELDVVGSLALIEQFHLTEDKAFGQNMLACSAAGYRAFLAGVSTEQRRLAQLTSPDERVKGWKEWRARGEERLADLCAGLEAPEVKGWLGEATPAIREEAGTLHSRVSALLESVEKRMGEAGIPAEVRSDETLSGLDKILSAVDAESGPPALDDPR
ncbi:MAG: hypothetical protein RDV41_10020 [Planctomycetota bacterium]|nr:hypothetical protein [Planctomycetota bacterium]